MQGNSPLTCPILVGRNREVAAVERVLNGAAAGGCAVAAVTGEPGIGKTRLVRDIEERALRRGFLVLTGQCREQDPDFPFAPFSDALHQFLASHRPRASDQSPAMRAVRSLLDRVHPIASPDSTTTPLFERRRLYEDFAGLFAALGDRQPVLLVLEDLHWSDSTSLGLIVMLPRRLSGVRIGLLLTARADEPGSRFQGALHELRRSRLLTLELPLEPLPVESVADMVEAMVGVRPALPVSAALRDRTDGNPLFVEELVAMAGRGGRMESVLAAAAVPTSVQETILRRLEDLDSDARVVAGVIAVIGSRAPVDLVQRLCVMPEERLFPALESLVRRRMIVEYTQDIGQPSGFAFRHVLTRDTIYGQILGVRRRALHLAIGRALEEAERPAGGSPVPEGDLAYHFHAAGECKKALLHGMKAGNSARAVHAISEALGHYRRAHGAASQLGDPLTLELDLLCGECLTLLGDFDAARRYLEDALSEARRREDIRAQQAALYDLAGLYTSRDYEAARRYAGEALTLARGLEPRSEALSLNRLGNILTNQLHFHEGLVLHEEALQRFRELDDRWGSADSLDLIGMARYLAGQIAEARSAFATAAAHFQELNDPERVASALSSRGLYLAVLDGPCVADAPPSAFRTDAECGLQLARDLKWPAGEAYGLVAIATVELAEGRHGLARSKAASALSLSQEIGHEQWTIIGRLTLGLVYADLLDFAGALTHFEPALESARRTGSAQWIERLEAWTAWCGIGLGDLRSIKAVEASAGKRADGLGSIGKRRAALAAAESALSNGNPAGALEIIEKLLEGPAGQRPPAVLLQRARALAALGRVAEADASLLEARRLAAEFGPRSLAWQIAAARSALWEGANDDVAVAESRTARSAVGELADSIGDPELRDTFLRAAAIRRWVAPSRRQRTALATGRPGGLTAREQDVARLVARGLSNRAIARELVLSEKTVEMHVSSCLAKLGHRSRAELAAWFVASGLASGPPSGVGPG